MTSRLMSVDLRTEYEARLLAQARAWKASHEIAYAEMEAKAWDDLAVPSKYQSGPLPVFLQQVLDAKTAELIRQATNGLTFEQWLQSNS